jgi:hypothetical protein
MIDKELVDKQLEELGETWKTIGTMMFTELLLSQRDDVEPHVLEKHNEQTEQYRLLLVKQTKLALKMRDLH